MKKNAMKMMVNEKDITWHFIRASGPGGQKINKTASAAQLRFHIKPSSLSDEVKQRLMRIAGNRINSEGELVITGRRFRTQPQNRRDALNRLIHFIQLASCPPPMRRKTKTPTVAKEQRLKDKHKRAAIKKSRRAPSLD